MPTAAEVLEWVDHSWDDDAAMLWNPPGSYDGLFPDRSVHVVPPTVWYALGLLHRGEDDDRAVRAIEAILAAQLDAPGAPWDGTFARFREFPPPQAGAREFVAYDPNWRQFVGCGLALTLLTAADRLPVPTLDAVWDAIGRAVAGEPPERITPAYTNIALLHAWLEVFAGTCLDRPGRTARGEDLAEQIAARFDVHGTFDEWNSPTYDGVHLLALALWRAHSPSTVLRSLGERLEAQMWADLGPWYHAGLANMAGPYTRAYGMDMRRYTAALGLWINEAVNGAVPSADGPVPALGPRVAHSHDLTLAPVVHLLGTRPSYPDLEAFGAERLLERPVSSDPERIATAWLSPSVMVGAERGARRWSGWAHYHPATVHWRAPDGHTRWIRLVHAGPVQATAGRGTLRATCLPHRSRGARPTTFLISAAIALGADRWELPGLTVSVDTDATYAGVGRSGQLDEVRYDAPASGTATFELTLQV